ncbi:hypothetical protein DFQ27_000439 [Actinomortierella ambigua]|uniref:ABC transporter domain-containing protein n=1 Tax=Actinomortierella ambigua TaxID=1343610 RepID=A0A9P6U9P9_9FUNG|nr:hypothetical protein DFQ27_000439 [Actinomortierella ambigua]
MDESKAGQAPGPRSPTTRQEQSSRRGILRNTSSFQPHPSILPVPQIFHNDTIDDEPEEEISPEEAYQNSIGGRWGEGPSKVDVADAERSFRRLDRRLTQLSRAESGKGPAEEKEPLGEGEAPKEAEFDLEEHLKDRILPAQQQQGIKLRHLGVVWRDLSVIGEGVGTQFIKTTGDPFVAVLNLFNPVFWARKCFSRADGTGGFRGKTVTKTILYPMSGYCQDGDMILVLGRPGSGCSTLLRVLANDRKNYKKILGSVTYNNLSPETVRKHYKGEVLYNQEDDFHYPTLTVRQTLDCAIKAKTPRTRLAELGSRKEFRTSILEVLTKMYGLTKQIDTLVGNAFIRGLSGGERKRLSIAEQMATRSTINMWDGSTRGLDASSALDYVKSLRVQTNLLKKATMVSIYQASENIYDLFDKTLLLYEGRCIYFGPAVDARQYFINLGFECPARQTTADFLTSITDPNERRPNQELLRANPNAAHGLPKTPEEFENAYKQSWFYHELMKQLEEYETRMGHSSVPNEFLQATKDDKQRHVSSKSPYMITFFNQIRAMTRRQVQLNRGDISSLISRYGSNIVKALIVGTSFFSLPKTASGAFTRGGVLFFSLLFNSLIAQAELPAALQGRPILYKLKNFAMYRPASFAIAQVVLDFPIIFIHNVLYAIVMYFLSGLQREAGKFFFFVLTLSVAALCMTSFFRMWGCYCETFDDATKFSGIILLAMILYSGYLVPYQSMHPWFIWIFWINPLAYAFKALISNEMSGLQFECDPPYLVPNGPGYDNIANQVCTLAGSKPGSRYVDGSDYLYASFRYKTSEMWLDFVGVLLFWVFFTLLTAFAMEIREFGKGGFSTNVFKKTKHHQPPSASVTGAGDPELGNIPSSNESFNTQTDDHATASDAGTVAANATQPKKMARGSVFSWENVDYVVPYKADPSGEKQLLCSVSGVVKPGTMTALMGSSGAGKTTLLDVLAQRKSIGKVTGQIEVDGLPLRRDFQRTTGYCEQLDVHVPECTVREALRFSAHLRQPADVSEADKDAYVEEIIKILEMENIADALIGTTESGLGISVEERKRLTIGVELVAKPKLLFLDEPTSGLDAQASYNIMRFMRKLTDQGQAILCTIHQPSSQLFAFFDNLLLLAKGGKTVFFGELGPDCRDLIGYFEKYGAPHCSPEANPAEYILDVVNARHLDLDWHSIWEASPQKAQLTEDIHATRVGQSQPADASNTAEPTAELEYAAPMMVQLKYVLRRMFKTYWRLPTYNMGRLFLMVVFALLNGFTFFRLGYRIVDLQSRVFAIFQVLVMAPLLCNVVEPRFHTERQWFYREMAGKYYGWKPFAISIILVEIPFVLVTSTAFFLVFYWTVGFTTDPVSTFYSWLLIQIFILFALTIGQVIAAWTPSTQIAALINPFVFSILNLFCGVMIPYDTMPRFWRSWLYWLDPYRYVIEGLVVTQLHGVPVRCEPLEFSIFQPPAGQTCIQYAGRFMETAIGYLNNPDATTDCQYCQYAVGDQFFASLNMKFEYRWRNLGISCIYIVSNVVICVLGIRFMRGNKR